MNLNRAIAFSRLSFLEREIDDTDEMTDREICRTAWEKYQDTISEEEGLGKLLKLSDLLREVRCEFEDLRSDRKDALREVEAKLPEPGKVAEDNVEVHSAVQEKKVIKGELEQCEEVLRVIGFNQAMLSGFLRSYSVRLEIPSIPPQIRHREESEPSKSERKHMRDLARIIKGEDGVDSYNDLKKKHSEWMKERKVKTVTGESAVQSAKSGLVALGHVIPPHSYNTFKSKIMEWYDSSEVGRGHR